MKLMKNIMMLCLLLVMLCVPAMAEDEIAQELVMFGSVKLTVNADGEASLELSDTYTPGDIVRVAAPDVEGKTFSYWTNAYGTIISYNADIELTMYTDTILNAIYDAEVTAQPVAEFLSVTRTDTQIMLNAIATTLSGSITASGIRYSTTKSTLEDLKGTDDVTVEEASESNAGVNWLLDLAGDEDEIYYAVVYMTIGEETYYSEVKTLNISGLDYGFSSVAEILSSLLGISLENIDSNILATLANSLISVNFNANEGLGAMNPQGLLKSTATTLNTNTFTRNYYDFIGWNTELDGTGTSYQDGASVSLTASTTLYAQWKAIDYAISYDLQGGEADNPTSYNVESKDITLNNPTRMGYTFTGWTGTSIDVASLDVTISEGSHGEREYTATWTVNDYAISYDLDGGAVATANPEGYTIESEDITLNNPTKTGYTFAGWTGTSLDAAIETVTIKHGSIGNRKYIATWTVNDYAITYDLNGGTVSMANPSGYTIEHKDITLNNPTKTGYTFTGWTGTGLDALTETVTIASGSTGDRSYTANYTPITYAISYELNGGTNAPDNPTSYNIESATITLKDPTREGYGFGGWLYNGATVTEIAAGSIGDMTLTATWTETRPEISPAGYTLNAIKGQPASLTIYASGVNIEWDMNGTLPAGLAFSSNENSASITGTPELGTSGSYTCTITAKNGGGSAAANVAITVTSDMTDSGDVESGAPITTTTATGSSRTATQTAFRNGAGSVILSADVAITTESTDFAAKAKQPFTAAISVDVTIELHDPDYDSYAYSMDITGLPEWLMMEGELASNDNLAAGTATYHHEFMLTGTPSTSQDTRTITLNAIVTVSGDEPVLEASGSKEITISWSSEVQTTEIDNETVQTSAADIAAMDDEELQETFGNKTNIVLAGEVTDLLEVIQRLESVTVIETLDLSQVQGLTEVKLTENVSVQNLNISGNQSIKTVEVAGNSAFVSLSITNSSVDTIIANGCKSLETVNAEGSTSIVTLNVSETAITSLNVKNCTNLETVDASGCSSLESVNLEGCESLSYLNVNETPITSLNVQDCASLDVLYCASCDIGDLNIDGCDSLRDVDVRNNSLRVFNARNLENLRYLECRNQQIYNQHLGRAMNVNDFMRSRGRFARADTDEGEDNVSYLEHISNVKAYDEVGNNIAVEYDSETGEASFSSEPARITYDYDTGFENIMMDVTVYAIDDESDDTFNGTGPGETGSGGCVVGLVWLEALAVLLLASRKKHGE